MDSQQKNTASGFLPETNKSLIGGWHTEIRWFWDLCKRHGNDGSLLQGCSEFWNPGRWERIECVLGQGWNLVFIISTHRLWKDDKQYLWIYEINGHYEIALSVDNYEAVDLTFKEVVSKGAIPA